MKSNRIESVKRILMMAVGVWILAGGTSSEAANPKHRPGLIVVAKVEGSVEAIDSQGKTTYKLKKSDTLTEKYTVNVGPAASVTLAFSNGAIINLLENTTMVISEFLQDPFSSPFSSTELSQEPTTSVTKLQLVKGEMIGTVKKLRTEQGSSLVVNTPVGAAGVRGTIFSIKYDPNGGYTLSVTEGAVEITINGKTTTVKAGYSIFVMNGQVTGPTSISNTEQNRINQLAQNGTDATKWIYSDPLNKPLSNDWNAFIQKESITIKPIEITPVDPPK